MDHAGKLMFMTAKEAQEHAKDGVKGTVTHALTHSRTHALMHSRTHAFLFLSLDPLLLVTYFMLFFVQAW